MVGSLCQEIQSLGHEVAAFLPRYKSVDIQKWGLSPAVEELQVPIGSERLTGKLWQASRGGVRFYFLDQPEFFMREHFYGTALGDYPDNDRRFIFFQRGVLEALKGLNFKPDVIHAHDWQTGLIPVYLKTLYSGDSFFQKTRSVFTIHNLGYQGHFPPDSLPATGLGWEQCRMDRLEFYGKISFLKGALLDADALTTVSARYAQEIQTKEFGSGLEGVLAKRKDHLHGIVNGIDYKEWDPENDTDLASAYSLKQIEKKAANKTVLQKENSLVVDAKSPLIGIVSRLVDQKGLDILIPAFDALWQLGAQIVLLGTGEEKYHHVLRDIAKKNRGRIGVHILFDSKMAKRIYAGSDMLLVPSYYEPCGLGQMIALRYGTIPVVRATGGLADTIQEFDPRTGKGNGFVFTEYTSEELVRAVERAAQIYASEKKWLELVANAMTSDFSWAASAKKYVQLYEQIHPQRAGRKA